MASRSAIAALLALLGSGISSARSPAAVTPVLPTVVEELDGGTYTLEGRFGVDGEVSRALVWTVLSDYDHLGNFISSLRQSVIRRRSVHEVLLEQEGTGRALLAAKQFHVLLHVHEEPGREIDFHDVSHQDFDVYEGSWRILEKPQGLEIDYRLRAKPHLSLPGFIGKPAFDANAVELLSQLRAEIVKRDQLEPRH